MIEVFLPIRTWSEANLREHWAQRARRAQKQRLGDFGEMMTTGIVLDKPAATAVVALRQYLLMSRGLSFAERRERYGKTQRALIAYLHQKPIRKLISASREYLPLPEEMEN